ncbi:MAG: hypothetical protein KDC95_19465 [Planctomycetes bacterium]|nr:hypothetical protein [Planctomycetota bacterium]
MREEGLEPGSESELEERWICLEFSRDIALVTYGHELLRRCAGEPSGPEVLALWRSFAWTTSGSRVAGFQLSADAILEADRRVREAVHAGFPCACCGTPNHSEAGHGTYEICDVCGWEDDPVQFADPDRRGGANKESLREAREHYRRES